MAAYNTADPVSFTDTNAETGVTGKGSAAGTSSNMMGWVDQLKKASKNATGERGGAKSDKKGKKGGKDKKNKKKGKTKIKYQRRHDRYESENYLLRIEGSICCAFLIAVILWLLFNGMILLIVIIWSKGDVTHLHNTEDINHQPATLVSG